MGDTFRMWKESKSEGLDAILMVKIFLQSPVMAAKIKRVKVILRLLCDNLSPKLYVHLYPLINSSSLNFKFVSHNLFILL